MQMRVFILMCTMLLQMSTVQAQLLNKVANAVKNKADQKAVQKAEQAADKAMDAKWLKKDTTAPSK
jgi:uncharacterized Zn finger protein